MLKYLMEMAAWKKINWQLCKNVFLKMLGVVEGFFTVGGGIFF